MLIQIEERKTNKNQLLNFKEKYCGNTFAILTIAIFVLLNSTGCNGQVNQKENVQTPDSNLLAEYSTERDSVIYNQYKNGEKDGLWREFDKNNQLISEGYYMNGKANGLMKWYYEGGLVATGNMKDDKRNGLWKICDFHIKSNCIEANFKEDKKVGTWKILHDNGKLWKEQSWNDGKMVSEKCWDEKGDEIECD